jgi:SAM-dependent methyltransferase
MASRRRSPAYGEDLAYVHDVGYDFHARGLAPGLLTILEQAGLSGCLVVDLGCGSGIWAAHLCRAGYRVIGIDLSAAMIDLARRRVPEAKFYVASFLDYELPRCSAITALGEVFCFQFDGANNRRALARLLRRAYKALEPGGLLIFDITEIGLDRNRPQACRYGDDWACLVRFEYDDGRDQLLRHIVTFRQVGDLYRRREETHRVQLYDRREVAAMLRQAGFRVRTARRFGDYELLPGRAGFIARKP